jgi:hypothetical protein
VSLVVNEFRTLPVQEERLAKLISSTGLTGGSDSLDAI